MSTLKIESLDKIHEAAKEFIAGMDDRTVFALKENRSHSNCSRVSFPFRIRR